MATPYISRLSLLLICALCGCQQPQIDKEIIQNILFEANYISSGWGALYNGYYIDSDGGLYRFQYEAEDEPWKPESADIYSEKKLNEKYAHNRTSLGTIKANTLSRMFQLIDEAVQGPYSAREFIMVDAGITTYIAYRYKTETQAYIPVVLLVTGDYTERNLSDAGIELTKWLVPLMGGS